MKKDMTQEELPVKNQIYMPERLKRALMLSADRTITVVEAPTGYGKTVAVRQICKHAEGIKKWINIYDDNLSHGWNSLCVELFSASKVSRELLRSPFPADGMQRARFATEMDKLIQKEPLVLVLDDFHQIQSRQTSEFIRFLAREFHEREGNAWKAPFQRVDDRRNYCLLYGAFDGSQPYLWTGEISGNP